VFMAAAGGSNLFGIHWREFGESYKETTRVMLQAVARAMLKKMTRSAVKRGDGG
jgi:hypothetical protein